MLESIVAGQQNRRQSPIEKPACYQVTCSVCGMGFLGVINVILRSKLGCPGAALPPNDKTNMSTRYFFFLILVICLPLCSGTPPYGHVVITDTFFWLPGKNRRTFSCKKTVVNTANIFWLNGGRTVTGFHCIAPIITFQKKMKKNYYSRLSPVDKKIQ